MSAALRQLLEFGLFHGDPHPGNIFAMRDGRIAYVDFGNVAVLSQVNYGLHCSLQIAAESRKSSIIRYILLLVLGYFSSFWCFLFLFFCLSAK